MPSTIAPTPRFSTEREIIFLEISFGRQAALAIENARLHQKSRANIDPLKELEQAEIPISLAREP